MVLKVLNVNMVLFRCSELLNNRKLIFLCSKYRNKNGKRCIRFNSTKPTGHTTEVELSNGKKMTLTTGTYARFASGCVTAKFGDTSVMSTVVRGDVCTNDSMVPLTVNYRQKAAATGRIPTNFLRRELGYTEQEILTSRIIDRSVRPLFDERYSYETQVTCNLLAVDGLYDPDVLSINAASTVLSISDIPWNGPVGAVRVGLIDNEPIINPTRRELQQSTLNLVVTCTMHNLVVMLEGSGTDILEQDLRKAIRAGVKECNIIIQSILNLQRSIGKHKIELPTNATTNNDTTEFVRNFSEQKLCNIFSCYTHDKLSRDNAIKDLREQMLKIITQEAPNAIEDAKQAFNKLIKTTFRSLIFKLNTRCDGRKMDEVRNIECQVNLFQPLHGSAFFQRGQTQVLCTVTLDCIENALKMDTISMLASGVKEKNFFLHYEFPSYATNEIGKDSRFNRREIGHGALAEKGLRCVIPKDYPFAIRLTSEVLESNGSSSMASVCGGSLALMDAGVPITSPVAGVAIGLITNCPDKDRKHIADYRILTDILGIEDYLGDMDFKIVGTKRGFSAFQADVKIPGIPLKIVMESIMQATTAKNRIIGIMNKVIAVPRSGNKINTPIVEILEIPVRQRARFLGVGGSNIKKIFSETGVNIHLKDDNMYSIFAPNQNAMKEAREMIEKLLTKETEPELVFGDIYMAKITEIRENGIMITLYPNMMPTFLHISQLDRRKVHHPNALGLEVGQQIEVKYFGRDPVNGQIRLSRKVLQEATFDIRNLYSVEEA